LYSIVNFTDTRT